MYSYLIIDTNNLFLRSFYSSLKQNKVEKKKLQTSEKYRDVYSMTIEKALEKIKFLEKKFCFKTKESFVYLLFDNPTSTINLRKIISEGDYKSNREPNNLPKGFYNQLNFFIEVLKVYKDNWRIVQLIYSEADDLTKPLLEHLKPKKFERAMCVSADMDFARNITSAVHWYNYGTVYDEREFKSKFGFSPVGGKIILYKAIHGDKIDNIRNAVPWLKNRILLEIVNKYESVGEMFLEIDNSKFPVEVKNKLKDAQSQIQINEKLVDFIPIDCDIKDIIIECRENTNLLKWYFKKLGLKMEERMKNEDETIWGWCKEKSNIKTY